MSNALLACCIALYCPYPPVIVASWGNVGETSKLSWEIPYINEICGNTEIENCGNKEIETCGNRESEMCGNTMRGNVFVADKVLTHYPEIACLSLPGK